MENILIIGLGNPGKKYEDNRHNFGFMTLNQFAKNQKLVFVENKKFQSELAEFKIGDKKIILAKPQTFMNKSGIAAKKLVNFYKPKLTLAIYDDLNLNLGTIRLRFAGESGGHNGVKNLIENISEDFWRLKLGIGPQPTNLKSENFVLQNFKPQEKKLVAKIIIKSADLISEFLKTKKIEPKTINL
jgi:PTH1 family peptidyl-tRNA hydrolase